MNHAASETEIRVRSVEPRLVFSVLRLSRHRYHVTQGANSYVVTICGTDVCEDCSRRRGPCPHVAMRAVLRQMLLSNPTPHATIPHGPRWVHR